jgi:hypothetical protein
MLREDTMLGYVTSGTDQLVRACTFYDALSGSIGHQRLFEDGDMLNAFVLD